MNKHSETPIPLNAGIVDGWKSIEIESSAEHLVPVGAYSTEASAILTSSVYYGEHDSSPYTGKNRLEGSLLAIFVREGVAKRLLQAQRLLPEGYHLLVFDAYRPLQVQSSLFRFYHDQLRRQRPNMSRDALSAETQKYVSVPSSDPTRPSPHNTGGAVDLTIVKLPRAQSAILRRIDDQLAYEHIGTSDRTFLEAQKSAIVRRYATMLNFGTPFDHGGERAAIAYFEAQLANGAPLSPQEIKACNNRRLLYGVMTQVGMQAYGPEWWHYNAPESQMGAMVAGLPKATYGAAIFDAKNAAHEKLRRNVRHTAIRLRSGNDPRTLANHMPVEIITPRATAT